MFIPDNYTAFEHHEADQDAWLQKRPICENCKERIQDDFLYDIDGILYCEECAGDLFRKDADNYEKE